MPQHVPWVVHIKDQPGSSEQDIRDEPDWIQRRAHSIGFKNREGRRPGHADRDSDHEGEIEEARHQLEELRRKIDTGALVNFRDLIQHQPSFHLRHPENRSLGWRYVLETTEDWVKNKEKWPANVHKWQKAEDVEEGKKGETEKQEKSLHDGDNQDQQPHKEGEKPKLTAQERAFLEALDAERHYISSLKENDGRGKCPQTQNRTSITIDEQDQFTPDNWLPRHPGLIRLTGKHPMNAEPPPMQLFEGGLITPNELHFIRNHGPVPRLLWEFHKLDIEYNGHTLSLTMDQLKTRYRDSTINIPVTIACTGNRRKELNMLRKTKGANNAAASVGCAYWKGPLLRDVLLSAGVPETFPAGTRYWINFAGADRPSEGPYETSIPFEYAMDPTNDILLAMEMNDLPLPPDHGYPVRLIIPGYVAARCVKWLRRIWISGHENESYYHIWDNRLLPPFVKDKDSEFARVLFNHPSTAINQQNLNSVIVKPAQGEMIRMKEVKAGETYRIQGYAYNGAGHEVQQVEVSVDGGNGWLFATRRFPDFPIRHGSKFWSWVFWQVDVELADLVRAPSVMVKCLDAAKNTQPRESTWNIMGMMNNSWYTVMSETITDPKDKAPAVLFRHPTEAASLGGGWVQPSKEIKLAQAKQEAGTPRKQFTREEIEKHDKEDDCWIVVDNKVYDVTSVLEWHPGGKSAIMAHAGRCHHDTTDEFSSVHDDFAYGKLRECVLGQVTEKTANFIKHGAEAAAKERAGNAQKKGKGDHLALQKHRWVPVKLVDRRAVSSDTRTYTFELPVGKPSLGLGTCQHIQLGFHLQDKMLVRSYTPTRPILTQDDNAPASPTRSGSHSEKPQQNPSADQPRRSSAPSILQSKSTAPEGTFDLTIKTYFPTEDQPGGALSNLLDCMPLGEEVEIRGPTGDITYLGHGEFWIVGPSPRKARFERVSLVLGGSGITPGYTLMARILLTEGDATEVRAVDANRTEGDILLRDELDQFEECSRGQVKITHVLSRPGDGWTGERGRVDAGLLRRALFPPGEASAVFLCGPPGMVQGVALPALRDWGYVEDENMFGF